MWLTTLTALTRYSPNRSFPTCRAGRLRRKTGQRCTATFRKTRCSYEREALPIVSEAELLAAAKQARQKLRSSSSYEEAEDAVQSALLKTLTTKHPWDGRAKFSTWFMRVAINERLMEKRRRTVNRLLNAEPLEPDMITASATAEMDAIRAERIAMVCRAVRRLSFLTYQTFLMFYVDEMTAQEIADDLHANLQTVKARIYRAREFVKQECLE